MLKKLLLAITIGISSASAVAAADIGATSGQFYGLNYGINPNACPSYEQIKSDFTTIKKYTNRVRTFSMSVCNLAALALQAANELNMDIYLGMWIDTPATFQAEMAALTSVIQSGASFANVDAIIVGSEVLYRKDTDAAALADYIHKVGVMARPKGIKITTADVYYMFPPNVVAELDFLMMYVIYFYLSFMNFI
jgi:glucan 1,3-beta-glucosidase